MWVGVLELSVAVPVPTERLISQDTLLGHMLEAIPLN
jgi:hypothetical protein